METANKTGNKQRVISKFLRQKIGARFFKFIAVLIVVAASLIIIKDEIAWQFDLAATDEGISSDIVDQEKDKCNVFGIELRGDLMTYIPPSGADMEGGGNYSRNQTASENIVLAINEAQKNDRVKAIILEIDSYGGYPVAGEEVALALKRASKPTVALIRGGGVSAAYMAASGADEIFASKNSDVGSIGVTMSYLDYVKQNEKEGLTYIPLASGKFKDTGDPDKILTREEKDLLMRDIDIMHQNFVRMVAENRNLEIEKVAQLADGSSMLGEMALENGLIDRIGGMFEVEEFLKNKIGAEVDICW